TTPAEPRRGVGCHGLADRRRDPRGVRGRRPARRGGRQDPRSMRRGDRPRPGGFPVLCPGGHRQRCAAGPARPTSKESPVSAPTMDEATKLFADPMAYTDEAKLHAALTHLRTHAPVARVDVPGYRPFWAITK